MRCRRCERPGGFGLALGCGLITGGRLGDLFGCRRMYALGLAVFTAASLACGAAPSPSVLIAARVVQGDRGSAADAAGARDHQRRVHALVRRTVPGQARNASRRLDVTGTVLVRLGLVALVLPLIEGRRLGWPA